MFGPNEHGETVLGAQDGHPWYGVFNDPPDAGGPIARIDENSHDKASSLDESKTSFIDIVPNAPAGGFFQ
jgi:hypothetical protein